MPVIENIRPAGLDHQVVSVKGGCQNYRRKPCSDCPWRTDATGVFPAEAFVHSAGTSYDMSTTLFACHQSGKSKSAICAGFLLRAQHNLSTRLKQSHGHIDMTSVSDGGHELHDDYRTMAIANGVAVDDPALARCR